MKKTDDELLEELISETKAVETDTEEQHWRADDIILRAVEEAGYPKSAEYYRKIREYFWYS
jgi:hypothetical protein